MIAKPPGSRSYLPYLIFAAFFLLALVAARAAQAELRCAGLADVLAGLRTGYGELVLWQGRDRNGHYLIVTANPDGTSWSGLIRTDPEKVCLLMGGDKWSVGDAAALSSKEG